MSRGPYRYEIRVAETLDHHWSQWFAQMEIFPVDDSEGVGSVLRGNLPDQAALFGLLGQVRDLNLTLIAVRRSQAQESTRGKS